MLDVFSRCGVFRDLFNGIKGWRLPLETLCWTYWGTASPHSLLSDSQKGGGIPIMGSPFPTSPTLFILYPRITNSGVTEYDYPFPPSRT